MIIIYSWIVFDIDIFINCYVLFNLGTNQAEVGLPW